MTAPGLSTDFPGEARRVRRDACGCRPPNAQWLNREWQCAVCPRCASLCAGRGPDMRLRHPGAGAWPRGVPWAWPLALRAAAHQPPSRVQGHHLPTRVANRCHGNGSNRTNIFFPEKEIRARDAVRDARAAAAGDGARAARRARPEARPRAARRARGTRRGRADCCGPR